MKMEDLTAEEKVFLRNLRSLPVWKREKARKLIILALNKSDRADRLMDLREAGQISTDDLLRII